MPRKAASADPMDQTAEADEELLKLERPAASPPVEPEPRSDHIAETDTYLNRPDYGPNMSTYYPAGFPLP